MFVLGYGFFARSSFTTSPGLLSVGVIFVGGVWLIGLRIVTQGFIRFGRAEGVEILGDFFRPGVFSVGGDEFSLGAGYGLEQGATEVGNGGGGTAGEAVLGDGGDGLSQGGAEVVVRDVAGGEGVGDVAAGVLRDAASGFKFSCVIGAQEGVAERERQGASAATGGEESAHTGTIHD